MKSNRPYLQHMLQEVDFILTHSSGMNLDDFLADPVKQHAFIRSIEIIGEATKKIDPSFKDQYPHVEWRAMSGTRDRVIHNYINVDYGLIWSIIEIKLPQLKETLESILSEHEDA